MCVSLYHVRFPLVGISLLHFTTTSSSAPTTRDRLQISIGQFDHWRLVVGAARGLFSLTCRSRFFSVHNRLLWFRFWSHRYLLASDRPFVCSTWGRLLGGPLLPS